MRAPFRLALSFAMFGLAFAAAEAQEPGPLLKPAMPPTSSTRVRVQTSEENPIFFHFAAKVTDPKQKDKSHDVVVAFDCLPGKGYVSLKKWKSWGFEVPANRVGVLPELVIPCSQLAPKLSKGRDTEVRLTNIKLEIVEPPGDGDTVLLSDLLISIQELTRGADRAFETRVYFGDKFMEFTVPNAVVKRLGTGDDTPLPEPAVSPDKDLLPVVGPMTIYHGVPTFSYASVDGQATYKLPEGKNETINVGVTSTMNWPDGIMMTIGTARGLGIMVEQGKDLKGIGAGFDAMVGKAKLKEFRLGFLTGSNLKVPKDLVVKDVTIVVDRNNSSHFVWIGPRFLDAHFTDPVYACEPTGWKLYGRVKPELLMDIKTRTPPKKP
ncbi:MAG: hypothetical protein C0467_17075 [Planctomycetaceae bacterium]|nr:hypothetical protein [Planctomycetaceae bacterium]